VSSPLEVVHQDLLKLPRPVINIFGVVDQDMYIAVRDFMSTLISRGSPPLQLRIDSGGGSVSAGLDIYDLIRLYDNEVEGIVLARAASMAAVILQACTKRKCARHGAVLIHHVSSSSVKLDVLREKKARDALIADMERDQQRLYAILAKKTGQKITRIKAACKEERFMTAEEALAFKLIDEIV